MKIKVDSEKIIKAVKKLDGIEIVVENADDAREALDIVLAKSTTADGVRFKEIKDFNVSAFQQYETSAVDYKMVFLIEFIFAEDASLNSKVAVIKEFQTFFDKV